MIDVQQCAGSQTAEVDTGIIHEDHIDVMFVTGSWTGCQARVEWKTIPLILFEQMVAPVKHFFIEIENEQAVKAG